MTSPIKFNPISDSINEEKKHPFEMPSATQLSERTKNAWNDLQGKPHSPQAKLKRKAAEIKAYEKDMQYELAARKEAAANRLDIAVSYISYLSNKDEKELILSDIAAVHMHFTFDKASVKKVLGLIGDDKRREALAKRAFYMECDPGVCFRVLNWVPDYLKP